MGRQRLSQTELSNIRTKIEGVSNAANTLKVKSNESVSAQLIEAIKCVDELCTRKRDSSMLSMWCDSEATVNARKIGGLLLGFLRKRTTSSPKARQMFLDILDMSARSGLA